MYYKVNLNLNINLTACLEFEKNLTACLEFEKQERNKKRKQNFQKSIDGN